MIKNLFFIILLILISCGKNNEKKIEIPENFYMSAMIDNKLWSVTGKYDVKFSSQPGSDYNDYKINIHAKNFNVSPPEFYNSTIIFMFDFTPKPGRYYFNNDGSENLVSGIMAMYSYWVGDNPENKFSINGYIEIKSFTMDSISGTFSFAAKGETLNNDTMYFEQGKFNANYGGGDPSWPGPK